MSALSSYSQSAFLSWLTGTPMPTPPTGLYIALYTSDPTDAGGGTEVSGNGYIRQPFVATAQAPGMSGGTQIANNADIVFPTSTPGAYGTIVGAALFDLAVGGRFLLWSPLTAPINVAASGFFKFPVGTAIFTSN